MNTSGLLPKIAALSTFTLLTAAFVVYRSGALDSPAGPPPASTRDSASVHDTSRSRSPAHPAGSSSASLLPDLPDSVRMLMWSSKSAIVFDRSLLSGASATSATTAVRSSTTGSVTAQDTTTETAVPQSR